MDANVSTEDAKSARISVKRAIEGDGSDGEPILDANVGKGLKRRPKRSGTGRSYKLKGTSDFGSTAVEESETDCLAGTKSTECTEDIQSSELVLGDKSGLNHIQGLSIVKNRQKENNGNESDEHEIPLLNTGMALSVMKKRNRDERERESIKNESDLPGNGRTASDFLGEARCSGSNTLPVDIGRRNEHMLQSSLDDVRTRSWKDAGDVDQRDEPSLTRTQQSAKTSEMSSVQRLEGSIAVLSKQIRNMETTLLKSVNESRKENKRDILQVQTKLHDMDSDLNSLKALVAVGGDGSKRKGNAGKNTPVVMFFAEAFNTTVIRRVFERSVVKHIVDVSQGRGVDQYARAMSFAFNVLMFAVTPRAGETKEKYKSNTGQCFSLFRRGIVLSALLVAQRNTFSIFDNPDSVVCGKVFGNVKKPEWLREGFVQYSHINRARDLQEEIGTRKKASARGKEKKGQSMRVSNGTPLMQDTDDHNHVQNHVGIILYREIIDRLHDSRFHSKSALFEELLYLFVPWKRTGFNLDQMKTKLSWYSAYLPSENLLDVSKITLSTVEARTKPQTLNQSSTAESTVINSSNIQKLSELIEGHPEMILLVSHEVRIEEATESSNNCDANNVKTEPIRESLESEWDNSDDEEDEMGDTDDIEDAELDEARKENDQDSGKKTLTKTLNLIDISARFLSCYTGFVQHRTPLSLLKSDNYSLKSIYLTAVMFRCFVDHIMMEIDNKGIRTVIGKNMNSFTANGLQFSKMLPTPSKQISLLRNVLKRKQKEYDEQNIVMKKGTALEAPNNGEVNGHSPDIEEDIAELGIVTWD